MLEGEHVSPLLGDLGRAHPRHLTELAVQAVHVLRGDGPERRQDDPISQKGRDADLGCTVTCGEHLDLELDRLAEHRGRRELHRRPQRLSPGRHAHRGDDASESGASVELTVESNERVGQLQRVPTGVQAAQVEPVERPDAALGHAFFGRLEKGATLSLFASFGSPRTRSPMMLRWI